MYEKGWLGHKETVLHSGEGPIWAIEWRGNLIAWANDKVSGGRSCYRRHGLGLTVVPPFPRESKSTILHQVNG